MSGRPDLSLTPAERDRLLDEVLAAEPVAWATPGTDGYPVVGLAHAVRDGARLHLDGGAVPPDGAAVCVVVEQGATYDDITAVVARGQVVGARLALDDLVTFAFAKARPGP